MSWLRAFQKVEMDPVWLLRIFTVIPVLLVLLAGGGVLWLYFFVLSVLPDGKPQVELHGLSAEVRVLRDSRGVPGILGNTEEDVALVLGYVMAQDRLWQMDFLRRASQGRLAEVLGGQFLSDDHLMRTVSGAAAKYDAVDQLDDRARQWLERFVQGVNAYISAHAGKLPVEFSLLEYRPEPFSPDDVLRMFQTVAWESSPAPRVDPTMTRILGRLGTEQGMELLPGDLAAPSPFVPADLHGWVPEGLLFRRTSGRSDGLRVPGLRGGCAWTVGREKTRSGHPMLGCTVYQTLSAPGFWYRARLVAGDFYLSGAFVPGVPVAFIGSNQRVAWGCVSTAADDADLYIERLDSDSPKNYWRMGRWHSVRERQENYRTKSGSSVSHTVRLTETGPLVSEVHNGLAISLRWTGRDGLRFFPTFHALNRARSGDEIKTALKPLVAPVLHVVWADSDGGHGAQMAGLVPVRPPQSDGIIPMPAWTGVHDWTGYIPFDELPSTVDPRQGLSVVSDGRPGGMDYPLFMSCYWNDDARTERIKELLNQDKEHHRETFQRIQADCLSALAKELVPRISKALKDAHEKDQTAEKAVEILTSWDFQMGKDSSGAALFAVMYQTLVEGLFLEALGEQDYRRFTGYPFLPARVIRKIFVQGQNEWVKGVQPDPFLAKSFKEAVRRAKSLMGGNPSKWKWGPLHAAEFAHPVTTRSRFLEMLYDVGPVDMAGSGDTIDLAGWSHAHPFHVVDGVSLRQISDMTHPPELVGISPMGTSAHFFSPHYKDQTQAWAKGRFFREPIEQSDIRQTGSSVVVFLPGRAEKVSRR